MGTSACVKEVDRSALVAFAPDAPFLAAGTMAGAVDMSFSSSANLEILNLDFRSDDRDLPVSGAVPSSEPFNRLSWGKSPSSGSEEFSLGLIAGGLVDGNIGVWNPRLLMRYATINDALRCSWSDCSRLLNLVESYIRFCFFSSESEGIVCMNFYYVIENVE